MSRVLRSPGWAGPVVALLAVLAVVSLGVRSGLTKESGFPAKGLRLPETRGALVASVVEGSPAMKAGLKPGDVVTEYDGVKITRSGHLSRAVARTPIGRQVVLNVVRDGQPLHLTATITQLADAHGGESSSGRERTSLGLAVQSVTPRLARELGVKVTYGVLVRGVDDSGAAADAGIQPGDVIVEVNRRPVTSVKDLKRQLARHQDGSPLLMLVHRDREDLYIAVAS